MHVKLGRREVIPKRREGNEMMERYKVSYTKPTINEGNSERGVCGMQKERERK